MSQNPYHYHKGTKEHEEHESRQRHMRELGMRNHVPSEMSKVPLKERQMGVMEALAQRKKEQRARYKENAKTRAIQGKIHPPTTIKGHMAGIQEKTDELKRLLRH